MPSTFVSGLIRLPAAERAALAIALWDSLSEAERDAGTRTVTPEQAVELDRRWAEHLRRPLLQRVPWDNVWRPRRVAVGTGVSYDIAGSSGRPGEQAMIQAVDVKPRAGYRIWLQYSDGAAGEVDLSRFAGRGVVRGLGEIGRSLNPSRSGAVRVTRGGGDENRSLRGCPSTCNSRASRFKT